MKSSLRRGSALCAIAAFGMAAGCASPNRGASNFAGKIDRANIGLATRAQAALMANRTGEAVALAERAVANSPSDAGFRGLLGNIYLASGRFSSAASAYRDSLRLFPQQAPLVLKLALVEIALGRPGEAVALLDAARPALDPADYGLALALAGSSADALTVLDDAARAPDADGRTRQNLALAHALAGNWVQARTIAAQDVPADQLDQRIAQWAQMAAGGRPADRVAALIGVTPAIDSGMPVRLALAPPQPASPAAVAAATLPRIPAPVASPPATQKPVAMALQPIIEPATADPPARTPAMAEESPVAVEAPVAVAESIVRPAAEMVAAAAPIAALAPVHESAPPAMPAVAARPAPPPTPARSAPKTAIGQGKARSVVQLGAYGSLRRVSAAWDEASRRFAMLRDYVPTSARFESALGTVYRLAVRGFGSPGEAVALCGRLRRDGGSCFVRSSAGDEPVRLASR